MPSIKLKSKAKEVKSGFEPYDGPEPSKRGFYRAIIKKFQYGKNNSGSRGFFIVLELEAAQGDPKDHARFDGYPMFARGIIVESADGSALKEGAQRNLDNLLAALKSGEDPSVVLAKGNPDSESVDVLKIGGKNPIGVVVNVDMGFENYQGDQRPQVAGIFPYKESVNPTGSPEFSEEEDDESDLLDDDEEASEVDERAAELEEMGVAALRKLAKELGVKSSGNKDAVIEAILDAEFPPEDDEDGDEEDDEDDESEEDESDEDAEDEEDDDGEEEARREELESFDRAALKKILREAAPEFRVLKRHSDDDLRDAIIDNEFGDDTPF